MPLAVLPPVPSRNCFPYKRTLAFTHSTLRLPVERKAIRPSVSERHASGASWCGLGPAMLQEVGHDVVWHFAVRPLLATSHTSTTSGAVQALTHTLQASRPVLISSSTASTGASRLPVFMSAYSYGVVLALVLSALRIQSSATSPEGDGFSHVTHPALER
ncbi:hypothetical protein JB92DRAFT_3125086 [Gautieria morchelliformis]|nr:hypothetical protein JB92DRAFT_3125086 [Gautieria morchelliformis]